MEVFRAWEAAYSGPLDVRFVSRETNGGTAAALNSAIEAAWEAEWIWPIAADDLLIPDALAEWERARSLGADAMPAGYQAFGHDSNGEPIDEAHSKSRRLYGAPNITEGFRRGQHLSSGCSPFRRRFWEMVGFDEDLRTAEDTLFWLRIHRRGARFDPTRRPVVRVRYHALRKSFTPIARDRRTKIRMIKERKDQPVCDFLASERHFAEHLAPVWRALQPWARGRFMVPVGLRDYASNVLGVRAVRYGDTADMESADAGAEHLPVAYQQAKLFDLLKADSPLTATAAAGDQQQCAVAGRWTVYSEHGSGQCYNRKHSSYCNYAHRRSVALFLAPGARPAAQFRSLYPSIPTAEVGALMLDDWQSGALKVPRDGVVALSFHWNARVVPETSSAWQHYERVLPDLKARFGSKIIGHSHPRIADKMRQVYGAAGIEYVETFDEVLARASVYCVDNSSTLFSFAAAAPPCQSRPVVVLNCPAYRKGVQHGMRFWEFADIGPQVNQPGELIGAIKSVLTSDAGDFRRREAILDLVYTERSGGSAALAARAIEETLGRPLPSQVGHPKNRRHFVQAAHGRPSQVVRFSPKLNNQNGAMAEPKTVRMIADVTFTNRQHEGQVKRRSAFFTTESRAQVLESPKHLLAHRAPVLSAPIARGPKITKPTGPSKTKPAASQIDKAVEEPLAKSYFTTPKLKNELKRLGVFFKTGESKGVLYDRYLEHFEQLA